MMKIVQAPDPVLSQKAKPVKKFDEALHLLLDEMKQTLAKASDPEGVGLAAPQVGKSLQIFIARENPKDHFFVCINPKIESFETRKKENKKTDKEKKSAKSGTDKGVQLEGCLSLKDVWGVVTRHDGVMLSYQDENGKKYTKKCTGFFATIIQHEYDHLQGILFPKRTLEQKNPLYHSTKNAKGETEFEEIKL